MSSPKRIQRQRTKGWTMPEGTIFVGRGTHLGNPFRIYQHCSGRGGDWGIEDTGRMCRPMGHGFTREGAAKHSVTAYRRMLDDVYPPGSSARFILASTLAGHDVACWCATDQPCHGDVLLEVGQEATPPADTSADPGSSS